MNISRKRFEEIHNIPDSAIDTSDIPELDNRYNLKLYIMEFLDYTVS